jgi:hypothetical protein
VGAPRVRAIRAPLPAVKSFVRLEPWKCHEFETDLGVIAVRQPGKPR